MGLGDMARRAKDALNSEKGEQVSDSALDRGADLANRVTGGRYADKIEQGRDAVDARVGHDGATSGSGVGGVSDVSTAGGSDTASGNTTAGADRPSPTTGEAAGRHRADGDPDAGGSSGESRHRA